MCCDDDIEAVDDTGPVLEKDGRMRVKTHTRTEGTVGGGKWGMDALMSSVKAIAYCADDCPSTTRGCCVVVTVVVTIV